MEYNDFERSWYLADQSLFSDHMILKQIDRGELETIGDSDTKKRWERIQDVK